jgi:hypothetical protein
MERKRQCFKKIVRISLPITLATCYFHHSPVTSQLALLEERIKHSYPAMPRARGAAATLESLQLTLVGNIGQR